MAETISLAEARRALQQHFGPRLRGTQEDGHQMFANALVDDLHIPAPEADRLVDELLQTHAIYWVEGGAKMSTDSSLIGGQFGAQGLPPAAASGLTHAEGFWQL